VERAHVGGALPAPQRADPPDEELGQAAGVAHQGDLLALGGQAPGFLDGQPRLARTRAAADLDAWEVHEPVEDVGLVAGQQIGGGLPFGELGQQVLLRDGGTGEAVDEVVHVLGQGRIRLADDLAQRVLDAGRGMRDVGLVEDHPPRQVGHEEVRRQGGGRQRDEVHEAGVSRRPARMTVEVVAEQVLADARLVDRVDHLVEATADLVPLPLAQRDAAALHLDDGDADARPGDDDIGLTILPAIAKPLATEQDGAVRQVLLQCLDEQLLGGRSVHRLVRIPARRHTTPRSLTDPIPRSLALPGRLPRR
jgi:hypothetical protein